MTTTFDVGFIMDFESGEADDAAMLEGFADGIRSGRVWGLQGFYGRTATSLIEAGYITREGELTEKSHELIERVRNDA